MSNQLKITLSFKAENKDVYDILKRKPVMVDYICSLVRDNIQEDEDKAPENIKKYIDELINERMKVLERKGLSITKEVKEEGKDNIIDDDVAAMIMNEED